MAQNSPPAQASWTPYLALLGSIVALCVGTSFAKHLYPVVGATGACAWRVGGSALILAIIWRPWRLAMPRRDWLLVAAYGAVLGAMNLSFYLALRTIPLGLAISIEFSGPLAVAVLSSRKVADLVWVALAALGLAMLLPGAVGGAALDPTGVAFACAAAVFWALYIVLGKRTAHLPAGPTVALGVGVAALVVTPIGAFQAGSRLLAPTVVMMGFGVAALSSALPYSLEMIALRGLPKRTFGTLVSLEPAVGALAGFAFLGEVLHPMQWLSIAAVMTASVGTVWSSRAKARAELLAT